MNCPNKYKGLHNPTLVAWKLWRVSGATAFGKCASSKAHEWNAVIFYNAKLNFIRSSSQGLSRKVIKSKSSDPLKSSQTAYAMLTRDVWRSPPLTQISNYPVNNNR